jgi:phosphoglycolate phosphatase
LDLSHFDLIVFDKDGTLIDFHAMWSGWVEALAVDLETATGDTLAADLYAAVGYDAGARQALAGGLLAVSTMQALRDRTVDVLRARGVPRTEAEAAVAAAWRAPDPVATAKACADLLGLFGRLRDSGLRLGVATTDDRAPTLAMLEAFGVAGLVDAMVCGDDGIPVKPAPDMVLAVCRATGTAAARTLVVGDTVADMLMARAAGAVGVGVLTGVTGREALEAVAAEVWDRVDVIAAVCP